MSVPVAENDREHVPVFLFLFLISLSIMLSFFPSFFVFFFLSLVLSFFPSVFRLSFRFFSFFLSFVFFCFPYSTNAKYPSWHSSNFSFFHPAFFSLIISLIIHYFVLNNVFLFTSLVSCLFSILRFPVSSILYSWDTLRSTCWHFKYCFMIFVCVCIIFCFFSNLNVLWASYIHNWCDSDFISFT